MQDATRQLDDELLARVRSSRSLPSPPVVAARLIELGNDPNVGLGSLVEVLRTDPALSAQLLRIANSPLYARRRPAENLQQAVVMLGLDAVLTAALSLTIMGDRSALGSSKLSFHSRWTRSVHAAVASQLLAQRCRGLAPADAFLAALVQDIGILAIARVDHAAYEPLPGDSTHDDLVSAEIARLGADHAIVGAELLTAWCLPPHIVHAVRWSHEGGRVGDPEDRLASVVAVGGRLADAIAGQPGRIHDAAADADALLDIDEDAFCEVLDEIVAALPDLAPLLDADVPPADVLADLAAEAVLDRQLVQITAIEQMRDDLADLAETTRRLDEANRFDALTGLANRRHLDLKLDEEFRAARTRGDELSLLFIDLDDFKLVNDRFGHRAGDTVLRSVARAMQGALRENDHIGRFGGDEIVVILPTTGKLQAEAVASRLVEVLASHPCPIEDHQAHHQRITIGVASTSDIPPERGPEALLSAADDALLAAKRHHKGSWSSLVTHGFAPPDRSAPPGPVISARRSAP